MLLNESEAIIRSGQHIHLAGVDDAHYYRADQDLSKRLRPKFRQTKFPFCSHIPGIYRQAAHAGFQVCSAGIPTGDRYACPVRFRSPWIQSLPRHTGAIMEIRAMAGYTLGGSGIVHRGRTVELSSGNHPSSSAVRKIPASVDLEQFRNWCRPKRQAFSWFSPRKTTPRDLFQSTVIAKLL